MQRTKSKILSILLSLVMLLSLLPTTALAADNYPSPTAVSVNGGKSFSSSKLYYSNDDAACSDGSTGYNAAYDPATGTLTLNGYDGGKIALEGAEQKDLTIKLIGDNKITVNTVNGDMGIVAMSSPKSNITITADDGSNGKLTINVTSKGDAVGIGNNIAAGVNSGNVTIKGHADVQIEAKTLGTNKNSWGIYAGNVVIEENAKVAITVIAMQNTGGDLVYGIYANRDSYANGDVTINTDGEITVDASQAGSGGSAFSIGVKSEGNLRLTKVGGMTVKWKKNKAGTYGAPLSPAEEFDSSKYDKILNTTNCTVTYTPKVVPPTASVGNVIIEGVKDSPIHAAEVKITLKNDTFASTLSGNWIINLPNGLSQSVRRTDDTHAKITVSGTPTVTSYATLIIKIPAANLVSNADLTVTSNNNARYKIKASVAALGGSAGITGAAKYNEILTADTSAITGNTGTFSYQWKRNGTDITSATNSTYKLVEDDIGKTITVAITSSVESGTIVSSPTATVDKADGPAAPSAFTLSFTLNSDGTTYTATIPTVAGGEYSFDGTNYSATNSKADCAANTGYTGYVRIAETSTHKASTATSSTQTSPKLTVATPTFTPNGASGFTGTQSVTISCTTVGATIHYTTDGTEPTASSPVYSTELSLTSTTTVKAIAVKADMNDSAIATATFTKASGGGSFGGYVPTVQKPEITIIGSGKADLSADGRTATITANAGHELVSVVLNGKEMGKVEKLTGLKTGDKATITFRAKTDGKAEMDKMIAQKASKLTLMARSKKTAKLNIKVVVKGDLKAITDAGYTVKYKFYRSTKKSAGYKAVLTKKAPTYVNTYGKQGTMYYYKARVMIYDKDGNFVAQTALKQCKYANRLWTK